MVLNSLKNGVWMQLDVQLCKIVRLIHPLCHIVLNSHSTSLSALLRPYTVLLKNLGHLKQLLRVVLKDA